MSNNTKTYIILGIVLLIWGIIGFRILGAISPEPELVAPQKRMAFQEIELTPKDTFSIKADYRDPFLGTLTSKKEKKKTQKVVQDQTFDREVLYTGSMVNHSSGKRIYFISINGQQYLLEKGKQAMEVLLISGSEQYVTIKYKGMVKRIGLQS